MQTSTPTPTTTRPPADDAIFDKRAVVAGLAVAILAGAAALIWKLSAPPEPDMTKLFGSLPQGAPIAIDKAILGANPGFGTDRSYGVNCTHCVATYELRRRGYDVTAAPLPSGNGRVASDYLAPFRALAPLRAVKADQVLVVEAPEAYVHGPRILALVDKLAAVVAKLEVPA